MGEYLVACATFIISSSVFGWTAVRETLHLLAMHGFSTSKTLGED